MSDLERERLEFEAWGNAKGAHIEQTWNGEFYDNTLVESAHQGWLARAAREDELVTVLRQAICAHSHASGGNDYMACPDCGLQWDYRKQTAAQAIRVCAWAEQARRAATSSQTKDDAPQTQRMYDTCVITPTSGRVCERGTCACEVRHKVILRTR